MIKSIENQETVLILSKNAKKLANFYKEKVGLPLSYAGIVGKNNEQLYFFEMEQGSVLYIADAAIKVKPTLSRNVLNFEVENIQSETRRLEDIGIKRVHGIYQIQELGYVSVFQDIEGNYFQLIQTIGINNQKKEARIIN